MNSLHCMCVSVRVRVVYGVCVCGVCQSVNSCRHSHRRTSRVSSNVIRRLYTLCDVSFAQQFLESRPRDALLPLAPRLRRGDASERGAP